MRNFSIFTLLIFSGAVKTFSQAEKTWSVTVNDVYYDATRVQFDSVQIYKGEAEGKFGSYQYLKSGGGRRVMCEGIRVKGEAVEIHSYAYSDNGVVSEHFHRQSTSGREVSSYLINGRKLWDHTQHPRKPLVRHSVYYSRTGVRSSSGREKGRAISKGCDAGIPVYHKSGFWIYYLKGFPALVWFHAGLFYRRV